MISSTLLIKCSIAIILLLQASSAFVMPSANVGSNSFFSTIISGKHTHDISCYATNKRENCPGKTAFKSKNRIPGVGGMNYGQKKGNTQGATKKVITKNNTTKKVMKSTNKTKTKISSNISSSAPKADIDWPTIIAGFLTPWRNPNSIFLYMLIILTVLGKYNEANP